MTLTVHRAGGGGGGGGGYDDRRDDRRRDDRRDYDRRDDRRDDRCSDAEAGCRTCLHFRWTRNEVVLKRFIRDDQNEIVPINDNKCKLQVGTVVSL